MPINFRVVDRSCVEFIYVEKVFNTIITKLYGSQEEPLSKIGGSGDRLCEMLLEDKKPLGFIVYKKDLVEGALELKTLCLLDPDHDSGRGYGTLLFNRVMDSAVRRKADRIFVTVSSGSPSLNFFKNKGFNSIEICPDKYVAGYAENILSCPVQAQPDVTPRMSHSSTSRRLLVEPVAHNRERQPVASSSSSTVEPGSERQQAHVQPQDLPPDFQRPIGPQYMNAIRSGTKTYEGRVATPSYRDITPGKTVEWFSNQNPQHKLRTQITSRNVYLSFEEMLTAVGYEKFVPEARNLEDAKKLYDEIPGYSEQVKEYGAVALGVQISPLFERHKAASSGDNVSSLRGDDQPGRKREHMNESDREKTQDVQSQQKRGRNG